MKYFKKLTLIGLIISFYFIQVSYNGRPSESLGSGLKNFISEGYLFDTYLIYIAVNLLFIIIPMLIWYYWKIIYEGIIDINLYIKSSIPYLFFCFLSLFIGIYKPKE